MRRLGRLFIGLLSLSMLVAGGCPSGDPVALSNQTDAGSLTSGGAPVIPAGDQSSPGPSAPGSGGDTTSSPTAAGDVSDPSFDAQLSAEFPTCLEPRDADSLREQILNLVNEERAKFGLNPVARNQTLEDQATEYACEMIQFDFFAHVNPVTGSTLRERTNDFGYPYQVVGENLAAGQTTVQQAMNDWIASTEHRENILDPRFTELGVGVRTGGSYGTYWVQEFGRPISADGAESTGP